MTDKEDGSYMVRRIWNIFLVEDGICKYFVDIQKSHPPCRRTRLRWTWTEVTGQSKKLICGSRLLRWTVAKSGCFLHLLGLPLLQLWVWAALCWATEPTFLLSPHPDPSNVNSRLWMSRVVQPTC